MNLDGIKIVARDRAQRCVRITAGTMFVLLSLLAIGATDAVAEVEVNTCGQSYSGAGFLGGDLDCTGFPTNAVTIQGGKLDLRGFTLTGGNDNGVFCSRSCSVYSSAPGGMIVGALGNAIEAFSGSSAPANIAMSNITLDANGFGVYASFGSVTTADVTITNTGGDVITAVGRPAKLVRTTISVAGGRGVFGEPAKVIDSMVLGTTSGVQGSRVVIDNSTIDGCTGDGVIGTPARVIDSFVTDNGQDGLNVSGFETLRVIRSDISGNVGRGIEAGGGAPRVTVKESTISNNGEEGIFGTGRIRVTTNSVVSNNGLDGVSTATTMIDCPDLSIVDSTVTGNGLDAVCGVSETCADVAACSLPSIVSTTCDTSYDVNSGFPGSNWGVCSLD